MKYKMLIAIVLVVSFSFSLVACGESDVYTGSETDSYVQIESNIDESDNSSVAEEQSSVSETVSVSEPKPKPIKIDGISDSKMAEISALSNKLNPWGQGVKKDELNRPTGSMSAQQKYDKFGAKFIMENSNNVYLTFDEGYENGYTASILDTLKEKNVKAVFFVTLSYVKKNDKLVKRMIDEGHIVGNHSSKHFSYPTKTLKEVYDDFVGLHNYMIENYDYEMKLFRFPMGEYSEQTLALVQALGYESLFWSFAYMDWEPENQPDTEEAFNKITSNAHPGALYLLHAVSKTNTDILGRVIDKLRADGYVIAEYPLN